MIRWLCVNMGSSDEEFVLYELEEMKQGMRELRSEVEPEEWQSIRAEFRANGCWYCIGERPGCGLVRVEPLRKPLRDARSITQLASDLAASYEISVEEAVETLRRYLATEPITSETLGLEKLSKPLDDRSLMDDPE